MIEANKDNQRQSRLPRISGKLARQCAQEWVAEPTKYPDLAAFFSSFGNSDVTNVFEVILRMELAGEIGFQRLSNQSETSISPPTSTDQI